MIVQILFIEIIPFFFLYMQSTLLKYVLQSLQGEISGFHFLFLFLKTVKLGNSRLVFGSIPYIIGPRQDMLSRSGDSPLLTIYISVARTWTFLLWIEMKLSFSLVFYKMIVCREILYTNIFHEDCLFSYLQNGFDTSNRMDNKLIKNRKRYSWECMF